MGVDRRLFENAGYYGTRVAREYYRISERSLRPTYMSVACYVY
jgi:hypothetical protein